MQLGEPEDSFSVFSELHIDIFEQLVDLLVNFFDFALIQNIGGKLP